MTEDNNITSPTQPDITDRRSDSQQGPMTIGNAKSIYRKFGVDLRIDTISIVKLIRGSGINLPLQNCNYLHALSYTDLMLSHTQCNFRMLTGCAGGGFLDCLLERFDEMLARLKKNGGKAKIILVNSESSGPLVSLKEKYADSLEYTEASTNEDANIRHYIVSDDDMVRDEEPHPKLTDEQSAELIQAKVYFRNTSKAAALIQEFDAIWSHLKGISGA